MARRPIRRATAIRRVGSLTPRPIRSRRAAAAGLAAARARAGQSGHRRRPGRGQADGDAGLSDRLGARSLARRFRAAGGDALVRRARRRDQADLRLFLPRHERQSERAYFRARLRQRARYRGLHARRRTAHLGEGRLEGHAGRAGLSARRAGRRLPAVQHRAGAGLQRLSLRSHSRRPDAPRLEAPASASRRRCRAKRSPRGRPGAIPMRRASRCVTGSLGGKSRRIGQGGRRSTRKTNSRTSESICRGCGEIPGRPAFSRLSPPAAVPAGRERRRSADRACIPSSAAASRPSSLASRPRQSSPAFAALALQDGFGRGEPQRDRRDAAGGDADELERAGRDHGAGADLDQRPLRIAAADRALVERALALAPALEVRRS